MKIAIVIHDLKGGGAEKMMVRLANGLAALDQDVNLILLTKEGVNRTLVSKDVQVTELCSKRTALSFLNLRKHLKESQPDRILSALTHVNVVAIITSLSLGWCNKLFVSERNAFSLDKYVNNDPLIKLCYFIAPWLYNKISNPVIAVSEGVASDLVNNSHVKPDHVITAPNPVLDNDYRNKKYNPSVHPWLIDKKHPTFIAAGRLAHQKGFDLLLDAFAIVKKQNDCRLIIYGEGPLREKLEQQIASLGIKESVSLYGYVSEVLNEMAAADVFVLSSRFEGSPNVLVEAMSTGVRVVATDCPYGPDEILISGQIGYLVELESVNKLAQSMLASLVDNKYDVNLQMNRAKIYTVNNSARSYLKLLVHEHD